MMPCHALLRRAAFPFLVVFLAASPSVATAAGLCLQESLGSRQYVLNKVSPKIASAKAKPFGGVSVDGLQVRPLSGTATKSSNAHQISIGFTEYAADVSANGFSLAGASTLHQVAIIQSDGVWDIGDVGTDCYWDGGVGAGLPTCQGLTAIDCSTVVLP